jgi:hypothetical protein
VWITPGFSSFNFVAPSPSARSGNAISVMGCTVPQPFAARGILSYLEFWGVTGGPQYLGY